MQYSEGQIGRVFVVRFDHGENFLDEIKSFVSEKVVQTGNVQFIGALKEGMLVTGPEEPVLPPVPHKEHFHDGWEIMGLATIYPTDEGPALHLHATAGRGKNVLTGCLREKAVTYIIVEAIITEFIGMSARHGYDSGTGLNLPKLG